MSKSTYSISFIGSGNVATHLAVALKAAGHRLEYIWSRNPAHGQKLAEQIPGCKATTDLNFYNVPSEIFLLSVPDDQIEIISNNIKIRSSAIILHTAGSVSIDALSGKFSTEQTGVFYPLQTFKKEQKLDLREVPILIESYADSVDTILNSLAGSISNSVMYMNSEDRKLIHLAAVFASNFINHILYSSQRILTSADGDLSLLQPLVEQTIRNVFQLGTDESLTGPAKRNDENTIASHIELLSKYPEIRDLYALITDQILSRSNTDQ